MTADRLEQLLALREAVDHEIRAIRRRRGLADRRWQTDRRGRAASDDVMHERLDALGTTSLGVKLWAVEAGLLEAVKRGRLSNDLIDAYAAAHPTDPTRSGTVSR